MSIRRTRSSNDSRRATWLVGIGTGAMVVAFIAVVVISNNDSTGDGPSLSSSGAGTVELTSFDGQTMTLDELAGQPLVVNFFASWCGPCAREMPDFEAVHLERAGDVVFVGVNIQDSPQAALALIERTGVTYTVVRDLDSELFRAIGGISMPTTVFITADGVIDTVRSGEISAGALRTRIDQLVGTQ